MALAALDVKRGGMRANLGQEYTQRMCAMDIKRVMSFDLQTFAMHVWNLLEASDV